MPPVPDISLPEYIIERTRLYGSAPALIDGPTGRVVRYDELEPMVRSTAAGLYARGLREGDVLAILSGNCIEYPVALHAGALLGAKVTTLSSMSTPYEAARQLTDANASHVIAGGAQLGTAKAAVEEVSAKGAAPLRMYTFDDDAADADVEPFSALLAGGPSPPPPTFDPVAHVAFIPYSSGTSGLPKGVELTHKNVLANILQAEVAHLSLTTDDCLIGVLPFFHIYGLTALLNCALSSGASIVTLPQFDPALFLRVLKEHKVTVAHVAPPLVGFLAKHPAVDAVLPLPHLKELFSGAAPLGVELEGEARARLGVFVRQGYGMTEAAPITHIVPYDRGRAGDANGAVGELMPGMECKIVDITSGDPVGVGERGEILLRGPNIMKGYLDRPDANAESFDEAGFYRTGDVGYVDDKGLYYVVDRVKELIKVKGYQVPPAELEAALLGCEAIADAAVIGIECGKRGELPKAYVVRQKGHEGLSAEAVSDYLRGKVAEYKQVAAEHVEFIEAVPKSAAGKILRKQLRAMEAERERAAAAA